MVCPIRSRRVGRLPARLKHKSPLKRQRMASSSTSTSSPITPPAIQAASLRLQLLNDHLSINRTTPKPWDAVEQKYKYTVTPWADEALTAEERAFFEVNGYTIKKAVCSVNECERWRARFKQFATGELKPVEGMGVMRDLGAIKKIKAGELPQELLNSERTLYKVGASEATSSWLIERHGGLTSCRYSSPTVSGQQINDFMVRLYRLTHSVCGQLTFLFSRTTRYSLNGRNTPTSPKSPEPSADPMSRVSITWSST